MNNIDEIYNSLPWRASELSTMTDRDRCLLNAVHAYNTTVPKEDRIFIRYSGLFRKLIIAPDEHTYMQELKNREWETITRVR